MSRSLLRLAPCLLALAAFLPIAVPAAPPAAAPQPKEPNANIRFSIPAPADAKSRDAFLIERPRYVLMGEQFCWPVKRGRNL
jgi:hypothetical protein